MDELKKILGEDLFKQVADKLGDKQLFVYDKNQKVVIDDGKFIPQYRLDEVITKNKLLTEQLEKSEKDLKELKKLAQGNQELTDKLTSLQEENKALKIKSEQEFTNLKKQLAVKEELLNAGVVDSDARDLLLNKFSLDSLELTPEGKIKDFETHLKPIKENKVLSQLFGEVKMAGTGHKNKPVQNTDISSYTLEQLNAMSEEDVLNNFEQVQKALENIYKK